MHIGHFGPDIGIFGPMSHSRPENNRNKVPTYHLISSGMIFLDLWKLCHHWEYLASNTLVVWSRARTANRSLWLLEELETQLQTMLPWTRQRSYTRQIPALGPPPGLTAPGFQGPWALLELLHWITSYFWQEAWMNKRLTKTRFWNWVFLTWTGLSGLGLEVWRRRALNTASLLATSARSVADFHYSNIEKVPAMHHWFALY